MSARNTAQEDFPDNRASETTDQPVSMHDDSGAAQSEAEYIPEREFVLMPLFRRIGQMLGVYRPAEPEYIYSPEPVASQPNHLAGAQPEQASQLEVQSLHSQEQEVEDVPINVRAATEDILGIEPEISPEPELERSMAPEPEIIHAPHLQLQPEPEPERPVVFESPQPTVLPQVEADESQFQPAIIEEAISPQPETIHASAASSQPATPPSALTQQEATDLAAQIREAASKISMAVSQAAEWLHSKEEEILRRTETLRRPTAPEAQIAELESVQASSPQAYPALPQWEEPKEVPALQREVAWQEERPWTAEGVEVPAASQEKKIEKRQRRPQLVSRPPALPFWKRIDWAKEFAPKRVAVLGAFVMAILMVLGISLARRPASSVLPEQTRTIAPRGVTLTTHPEASPAPLPARSQRNLSASHPTATPVQKQARAASRRDDGPEVVTHYYGKPKPSPVRQAAASGVHHYSDLQ